MSTGQKYVGKADNAKTNQSNGKKATQKAASVTQTAPSADLTPAAEAPQPNNNEATPEQWNYYGRDILREPFVSNTISLEIQTSTTGGNPQSLILLFALNNHQDYLTKEMLTALGEKHHQDAYAWHWELQLCNDLIFKIAQGLGGLSQNNLSAAMRLGNRTEYDQGTHREVRQNEKLYAKFLRDNLGLTIDEADEEESEANNAVRKAMQKAWGSPQQDEDKPDESYLIRVSQELPGATIGRIIDMLVESKAQPEATKNAAFQIILQEMTKRADNTPQ